jgi:hypothetical protein
MALVSASEIFNYIPAVLKLQMDANINYIRLSNYLNRTLQLMESPENGKLGSRSYKYHAIPSNGQELAFYSLFLIFTFV